MEARVFFPVADDDAPTMTKSKFVSAALPVPKPDDFAFALSKDAPEKREDLYLVLPPTCGGNLLGIKFRGFATPQDGARGGLERLRECPLEVKVASTDDRAVQSWRKLRVGSLRGTAASAVPASKSVSAASAAPAAVSDASKFTSALIATLASLTRSCDSPFMVDTLQKAAAALSGELEQQQQQGSEPAPLFKLFAVKKSRVDGVFVGGSTRWNFEEADMAVTDVTPLFVPGVVPKIAAGSKFRSWCLEPMSDKKNDAFAKEFCVLAASKFEATVASYPAFLCGVAW